MTVVRAASDYVADDPGLLERLAHEARRSQSIIKPSNLEPFDAQSALSRLHLNPIPNRVDPSLPPCPLCGSSAISGPYNRFDAIGHDCNCVLEEDDDYQRGLRTIWNWTNNQPEFVARLPELYRGYAQTSVPIHAGNGRALLEANRFESGSILYLHGTPGTGKTHLGIHTAYKLIGKVSGAFWNETTLFKRLRTIAGEPFDMPLERRAKVPDLENPGVLVLDDFGKTKASDYVFETLYQVLEHRYSHRLTTIITSQFKPSVAAKRLNQDSLQASSLASRVASGIVVEITGSDHRIGGER